MADAVDNGSALKRPSNTSAVDVERIHSFQSSSLEEACDFISGIFCPHELKPVRQGDNASVKVRHAPLAQTSVNYLSHGARVTIEPEYFKSFYLLQAPISGSAILRRGERAVEVRTGDATITAPDEEIWMDWSEDCEKIILRIDRTTFEKMYGSVTGASPTKPLHFEQVISFDRGPMRSAWRMIRMIADDLMENEGSIFQNDFAMQHMEQSILFALINSGIYPESAGRADRLAEIAPRQVRIVEEFIRENAAEPITIDQLVEVSGVSARTLFDNFKKFRGVTPMRYVRDVRLQCVRERLMNPRSSDSVTTIAMQWGFAQLGRFAAVYKQEFGESPSQTLKRAQSSTVITH